MSEAPEGVSGGTQSGDTPFAAARPVGVEPGWIVARSFGIYARNLVPFTIIMALVSAPEIGLTWLYLDAAATSRDVGAVFFGALGIGALGLVLSFVGSGAIIFGVFRLLRDGRAASTGECLARGFRSLLPVVGVAIVSGLVIMAGFLLLVVPGVILAVALYVAVPAAVVEDAGVGDALSRSLALTKGSRGRIFAVLLVVGVLNWGIDRLLQAVFLEGVGGGADALLWYFALSSLLGVVFSAVSAVTAALVFYQLVVDAEGVDAAALAAIFE